MCLLPYSIIEHQTSARDTSQQVALANVLCCSIPNTIRKDPTNQVVPPKVQP